MIDSSGVFAVTILVPCHYYSTNFWNGLMVRLYVLQSALHSFRYMMNGLNLWYESKDALSLAGAVKGVMYLCSGKGFGLHCF
jgi:hypothetical protein